MILKFTDLVAWKEAHKLVLMSYILLNKFPKNEAFALCDQIRRCAVSISANIAEGFSRHSKKEKLQFYYISKGSLTELENHFLIARDLNYIDITDLGKIQLQMELVGRLLTGLLRSVF
jgi:four helix bundle protein